MNIDKLVVRGAREHNLKDVSIELPRDALIVLPGFQAPVNQALPLTPSLPKVSVVMSNLFQHMPDSS